MHSATAQTNATQTGSEITLAPLTISVTRIDAQNFDTPASVDVVGRQQIEAAKWQVNVSEVLGTVPGLVVNNRGNFAQDLQISSRGFGARTAFGVRGLRIFVDGIPGNSPDGQGQVSHIDLGSAKQIEVLRGPFSALYGNSSGGVINVTSQEGGLDTVSTTSLGIGTAGSNRLAQKISGSNGIFNYVVDASRFSTDGWRDHSGAQKDNVNARLGFKFSNATQAVLVINRVNLPDAQDAQGVGLAGLANPQAVPPAVLTFNTRKSTEQNQVGLNLTHRFTPEHSLMMMAYGGTRDVTQFQSIPIGAQNASTAAGGVVDFQRQYQGLEGRWTWRQSLANGPLLLHAGFTADKLNEDRRGFENFEPNTANNPDPLCVNGGSRLFNCGVQGKLRRNETNKLKSSDQYLQGQWWPVANLALHAGIRKSRISLDSQDQFIRTATPLNPDDSGTVAYSGTTPFLGALFNLTDRVNLYASLGRGFDAPTLNETAYNPDATKSGLNLTLKPSRSQQWEVGAKFKPTSLMNLQVAVFQAKTSDEIVVLSNSGGRSRFQNAGETKRRGLELGYSHRFAPGWSTQWAYSYLDATYQDPFTACYITTCAPGAALASNRPQSVNAGKLIPGIPKNNLFADLAWRKADGSLEAGLEWKATGSVATNDLNTEFAPGYGTLAARVSLSQKTGGWTWKEFVRLENLTDKAYVGSVIVNQSNRQYYEPGLGKNWLLGITGSYKF